MLITEILARNARVYGKEIALVERDPARNSRKEITWEQFDAEANKVANALITMGVRKGDRVVHLMMNCIEWLPVYFGILRAGAWVVPLNFRFSGDDIKQCCQIAEAKVLLFGEEFIDRIESVKAALDKTIENYIFIGPENKRPDDTEPYSDFLTSGRGFDVDRARYSTGHLLLQRCGCLNKVSCSVPILIDDSFLFRHLSCVKLGTQVMEPLRKK